MVIISPTRTLPAPPSLLSSLFNQPKWSSTAILTPTPPSPRPQKKKFSQFRRTGTQAAIHIRPHSLHHHHLYLTITDSSGHLLKSSRLPPPHPTPPPTPAESCRTGTPEAIYIRSHSLLPISLTQVVNNLHHALPLPTTTPTQTPLFH